MNSDDGTNSTSPHVVTHKFISARNCPLAAVASPPLVNCYHVTTKNTILDRRGLEGPNGFRISVLSGSKENGTGFGIRNSSLLSNSSCSRAAESKESSSRVLAGGCSQGQLVNLIEPRTRTPLVDARRGPPSDIRASGRHPIMAVVVRDFRVEDEEQVQLLWYEGFMELPWDITSSLGKVRFFGARP